MSVEEHLREMFMLLPPPSGMSTERFTSYITRLNDLPDRLVCDAIDRLIKKKTFTPTIGEIRAEVFGVIPFKTGEEAWEEVLDRIKTNPFRTIPTFRNGTFYYPSIPVFSDSLIQAIVSSFGWREICQSETIHIIRAQFIKSYNEKKAKQIDQYHSGALPLSDGDFNALESGS